MNLITSEDKINLVKAGIVHAKAKGVKIGRPSLTIDRDELRQLRDSGLTIRAIADKTNLKRSFVHKTLLESPAVTPMKSRVENAETLVH
jgi:DNA invertase Pin-like site-specific DNA recombinase